MSFASFHAWHARVPSVSLPGAARVKFQHKAQHKAQAQHQAQDARTRRQSNGWINYAIRTSPLMSRGCDRRQPKQAVAAYTGYRWPGASRASSVLKGQAEASFRCHFLPVFLVQSALEQPALLDGASALVRAHHYRYLYMHQHLHCAVHSISIDTRYAIVCIDRERPVPCQCPPPATSAFSLYLVLSLMEPRPPGSSGLWCV